MNILKKQFVKIIDRITVEPAPHSLGGIVGFDNNEKLCNDNGYYFLRLSQQSGTTAVYERIDNAIVQSWVTIDTEAYAVRVVELIREKYSENEELAILRKGLAGIDGKSFKEYNEYCEMCKKVAKTEMIN